MLKNIKVSKSKFVVIIVFAFLCLFIGSNAYATEEVTKKLYQDITINSDGSITVKEAALLGGEYNGREREIKFKNYNATTFTGVYSNFTGNTDIYDGSGITNIKIYDISESNFETIYDVSKIEKVYKEVNSANKGQYGVYTLSEHGKGTDFRIYCPSSKEKVFGMEYTIEDAVVVHEDVAELYWNVLGDNYREKIEDFQVIVHLPGNDTDLRVWTHGPLSGVNQILDSKTVYFKDTNVKMRNAETIRIMFNKDLVPDASKKSGINGREYILKYEQTMANSANAKREKEKLDNLNKIEEILFELEEYPNILDYNRGKKLILNLNITQRQEYLTRLEKYKEAVNEKWKEDIKEDIEYITDDNYYLLSEYRLERLKEDIDEGFDEEAKKEFYQTVNVLDNILMQKFAKTRTGFRVFYAIIFVIVTILVLIKLARILIEKARYHGRYYRDFPSDDNPYVLEYLMKRNITNLSFSATILSLISKKVIKFEKIQDGKKEDIRLILNDKNYVGTKAESVVLNVLFDLVGKNSNICNLKDLKKYGSTETRAKSLINRINRFENEAKKEAEEKNYFSTNIFNIFQILGISIFWLFSIIMSFGLFYKLPNSGKEIIIYLLCITATCFVYLLIILKWKNRTIFGKEEYSKWLAHKRFLKDFSKFDEKDLPEIVLWEKYLVTATILGCADKVQKRLKMHINNFDEDNNYLLLATSMNSNFIRTINRSINSSVSTSRSAIAAANSSSSSGGGFGGGSSGGGGGRRRRRWRWSLLVKMVEIKNNVYNLIYKLRVSFVKNKYLTKIYKITYNTLSLDKKVVYFLWELDWY